jgi:hypothetical protein
MESVSKEYKVIVRTESLFPLLMVFIMGIVEMVIFSQKAFFLPFAILFAFNGTTKVPEQKINIIHKKLKARSIK